MMNITDLPPEISMEIIGELRVQDIHSLRYTCKTFYGITEDDSLWRKALCDLACQPLSWTLPSVASSMNIRQRALRAEIVKEQWHCDRRSPRHVRAYASNLIQDVQMLPGGEWLICLFAEGTLQLRNLNSMTVAYVVPNALDTRGYTVSSTSMTPQGLFYVLFHCTERLYIYEADVLTVQPWLRLVMVLSRSDLKGVTAIRHASLGGNLLGIDTYHYGNDMVYLRTVKPDEGDGHRQAGVLHYSSYCTIHIVSEDVVILSNGRRVLVYKVSGLKPLSDSCNLDIVSAEILWSHTFDALTPGFLSGSPSILNCMYSGHQGPLTMLGPGVLHIVQPSPDLMSYTIRTLRAPQVLTSTPAVGVQYALCAQREPGGGLVFKTCTFPRVPNQRPNVDALQVQPDRVLVGSFMIHDIQKMSAVVTRFDEWTGRICLVVQDDLAQKRLLIVDLF